MGRFGGKDPVDVQNFVIVQAVSNKNISGYEATDFGVVVTCHNSEKTISRTLLSILSQSHVEPNRVVVVDDASSDNSREIIEKFPFKCIFSTKNLGSGGAKHAGFLKIKSKFVAFLDSDDVWDVNFIETQIEAWNRADPNTAAIGFGLRLESNKADLGLEFQNLSKNRNLGYVNLHDLWLSNPFTNSSTVYDVEKLKSIGGYSKVHGVDDFDTIIRLYQKGYKLFVGPEKLGVYGISDDSISKNVERQFQAQIRSYKLLASFFPEQIDKSKLRKKIQTLWLRSIAKCANYNLSNKSIPTLKSIGLHWSYLKIMEFAFQVAILWYLTKRIWTYWNKIRLIIYSRGFFTRETNNSLIK